MTINQHYSVSHAFSAPNWSDVRSRRSIDSSSIIAHLVNSDLHTWERSLMLCQELDIYIYYIYDALDNRYGFSISVQHGIDCTTFHSLFSWKVWKKMILKIFKSWQVCDWLAKWIIMLRFMDLRWPRVFRRSSIGLVFLSSAAGERNFT